MGGAPWVAEQNVKIGGALNMEALPFDAVEILAGLIASRRGRSDSPNDFGIRNDLSQNIATQIYAQLQKHAALSSPTAPFWRGLANLPPRQRCQLGKDFRGRLEGNAIPPQKDFVAAKLDASQREAWNIALEEQPIILPQRAGADRKIERFGDLKRLQDQTGVFFDSSAREREVKKVRTDISAAASAGGHRAKQVLARSLELGKSIEGDAEAVRSDLPVVRHRIHWDYAGGFGLNLPDSLRFLNNGLGDDRPKRSEVDAFAQERMLNVLEETFKSLPYESRNLSSCTTLADFHSGSSAKGKQAPTAERLYSALQALASYKPPEGAEITQEDCRALVQIGQRILESSPPSNYTSIIR
jgi:hypothetical protein